MKKLILAGLGLGVVIGIALIAYTLLTPKIQGIERFESIPEEPSDFVAYSREIWKGTYVDLCDLPEEYWKQPGFYGESWKSAKSSFYDNPNYKSWGVYGQGNMPREISYSFTNLKKGDDFELCSFVHNGFGVWTYQGFKLVADGNKYFELEITPNEFVVAPTFPVFESEWVKKVRYRIVVKETPPIGEYSIKINIVAPSQEFSREQTSKVLHLEVDKERYFKDCIIFLGDKDRCNELVNNREKKYVEGGSYVPSVPPMTIGIIIQ